MMKLSKCPFTGGFKYGRFSFTAVSRSPLRKYEVVITEIHPHSNERELYQGGLTKPPIESEMEE